MSNQPVQTTVYAEKQQPQQPQQPSASKAIGLALGISGTAAVAWVLVGIGGVRLSVWQTPRPEPLMYREFVGRAAGPMLDLAKATRGHEVYAMSCITCHGADGLGKPGLGKDLVHSDFVFGQGDDALAAFVVKGRDLNDPLNTTKVAMPPRGGNASLTDADMAAVVQYVRGLQDPRRLPALPAVAATAAPPSEAEKAAALAAAGGDAELAGYIASGTKLFARTCAACHGADAKGLKNLGKDLTTSEFVGKTNDDDMLAFIKKGRNPGEPGNTTGVAMPPKGGNPALSDDDLLDIIAYLRTLNPTKPKSAASN